MKKVNVLNGWRTFNEKPMNNTRLLLVLRVKELGQVCIILLRSNELDSFRNDINYELLAWQYCPVWVYG